MPTQKLVADIAREVVEAKLRGLTVYHRGHVEVDLTESGMCARFVRECHEMAADAQEQTWPCRATDAKGIEANLRAGHYLVDTPQPGDICCLNRQSGKWGHIAIWLGDGLVAENTSCGSRGNPRNPGHKITPLTAIGASRVTCWARYYPAAPAQAAIRLIVTVAGVDHIVPNEIREGRMWAPVRDLADVGVGRLVDHSTDQRKVYLFVP